MFAFEFTHGWLARQSQEKYDTRTWYTVQTKDIPMFLWQYNKENGGTYKGCASLIKEVSKINFKVASNWLKCKIFWND